ncbi:MAG: YdeI/OmpD-associated family protein [Flavobacteriaceae bacterium]
MKLTAQATLQIQKPVSEVFEAIVNPVPTAELLLEAFKTNKKLKEAFEKLTSGKQKEYTLYINEAKQEATKIKRVEKIIPMILQGVGLHDKYK